MSNERTSKASDDEEEEEADVADCAVLVTESIKGRTTPVATSPKASRAEGVNATCI